MEYSSQNEISAEKPESNTKIEAQNEPGLYSQISFMLNLSKLPKRLDLLL